jgi:hypothetical protein
VQSSTPSKQNKKPSTLNIKYLTNTMKIITLQQIGYNAPSQANWCYDIYSVSLIDTDREYSYSYTVKDAFGQYVELQREVEKLNPNLKYKFIELKSVYTKTGTPKITGVQSMLSIDSKEFINLVAEFTLK